MKNVFYDIPVVEKEEFQSIINDIFYLQTLKLILDLLPPERHLTFLETFSLEPNEIDVEKAISKQAEQIKKEILLEIKRSRTAIGP